MSQHLQKSKLLVQTVKDLPNFQKRKLESHRKIGMATHFFIVHKNRKYFGMEWETPEQEYLQKIS